MDGFLQGGPHDLQWWRSAGPESQGLRALIEQHAEAVGRFAAGCLCSPKQRRFVRAINHVIDAGRTPGLQPGEVDRQGIIGIQTQGGGVNNQIDWISRITLDNTKAGMVLSQADGQFLSVLRCAVDQVDLPDFLLGQS